MSPRVFTLRRPPFHRESAGGPFTYPEVGATREDRLPAGYHHIAEWRAIGTGPDAFDAARQALRDWAGHVAAGIVVQPPLPLLEPGRAVHLVLRAGPLWASFADRIVWVVDQPTQFGFAYGTLRAHAEVGEESFVVDLAPDGTVTATIRGFSRLGHWLPRLGLPVTRAVEGRVTTAYLDGIAAAVARATAP